MSDKRQLANIVRELEKEVKVLQETVEAVSEVLTQLYNGTNGLYGQLVIRGVLPDPAVETSPFVKQ